MSKILVIGAGRSSTSLIKYLSENAETHGWEVTVADKDEALAREKAGQGEKVRAISFDITDQEQRQREVQAADLVISMLPAHMHVEVAQDCVELKKHLVTASYVSPAIRELDEAAREAGVILLNEMGLDPGIDHMSAMEVIHRISRQGGRLTAFKSYTGGLVDPGSLKDNPWKYKFTWNPRNVILAGQGTAKYIEEGKYRYVPYNRLFRTLDAITVDGESFEGYPNRDSLQYRSIYGLDDIPTMIRGTLRYKGYCKSWDAFVQLGLTDDSYEIENIENLTWRELIDAFLPAGRGTAEQKLVALVDSVDEEVLAKLKWLGLFSDKTVGVANASPAKALQVLLEDKWKLEEHDIDLVVMQHMFRYIKEGEAYELRSSMMVRGKDQTHTAMAETVGLPAAIGAKLILEGKINSHGVQVPVEKEIYEPVLAELKDHGIFFHEELEKLVEA